MSKSIDTWMPLYIGDYLADTMHLTAEEHGAYFLLMMAYWKNGGALQDEDKYLASICKMSADAWSKARAVLEPYFIIQKGKKWKHKRIEKEIKSAKELRAKKADKARNAANARWKYHDKSNT